MNQLRNRPWLELEDRLRVLDYRLTAPLRGRPVAADYAATAAEARAIRAELEARSDPAAIREAADPFSD